MAAEIPLLSPQLTLADRLGALRVRLGFGRDRYSVEPGLYRLGEPTAKSPVLVTSNYKLTVDAVRSSAGGVDAWLLVLDTKGVNVWCAAGKQTFGTKELCRRVVATRLDEVVDHRMLVLPQLGAPGVAAHEVTAFTEFNVVYGPVRAADIPAFLEAGMQAAPEMRRVRFNAWDRFVITGVELASALNWKVLVPAAAVLAASGLTRAGWSEGSMLARGVPLLAGGLLAVLAAAVSVVLLPWLPFRSFAAKGALIGALAGAMLAWATWPTLGGVGAATLLVGVTTVASFAGMNYTGASAITSPSGVQYEMEHAIPWQIAGAVITIVLWVVSAVVWTGRVG